MGLFQIKKGLFFFEKKNQKTFASLGGCWARPFFQKKGLSS